MSAYRKGGSHKAEMYLAKHLPFLQSQIGYAVSFHFFSLSPLVFLKFFFCPLLAWDSCFLILIRRSTPLPVEGLFAKLISDNLDVINAIQDDEVSQIVQLLRNDKDPDYLDMLAALCVCDGDSVADQQERITRILLEFNQDVVYLTEYDSKLQDVLVSETGKKNDWISLRKYVFFFFLH
jgi:hypothetical protein